MKVGIIAGNFDVIHPGYIAMFREASNVCDKVIVALHGDPSIERPNKLKPILSVDERVRTLESIRYIDDVVVYNFEKELEALIVKIKPDVRLLGDDYRKRKDYTGFGLCPEVYFFDRAHGWSTTKFKKLIKQNMELK